MCEKSTKFARGTVWWVNTKDDSMCSFSQKGKRPFLIINNDEYTIKFGKVTVIPLSHQDKYKYYETAIPTLFDGSYCYCLTDQIRQMDLKYLNDYAFTINKSDLAKINECIAKQYLDKNILLYNTDNIVKTEVINENCSEIDNEISNINYRISNLEYEYNKLSNIINEYSKEIVKLTSNLNNIISSINIDKVSQSTNIITDSVNNKANKQKTKCSKKSSSSMPYGYFSSVENNINFWNDDITYGKDYMIKKYKLKDVAQYLRRRSRVKQFLTKHGISTKGEICIENDSNK